MIAWWFQTPKARLESSSGLFPDFSRVTGHSEVIHLDVLTPFPSMSYVTAPNS
jgi:hypothetical protein